MPSASDKTGARGKENEPATRRRLIFRLSSLGDVILATSALSSRGGGANTPSDWVVAKEYAALLDGHPGIARVWAFDRSQGLRAWIQLCRELSRESYDEVLDLHASLRTRLARALMFLLGCRAPWTALAKARWRRWGYCLAKEKWPPALRPRPMVELFARLGGGTGQERPDLRHLLEKTRGAENAPVALGGDDSYVCVMPGARWPGKRWPVEKYAEMLTRLGKPVVVLGAESDKESAALAKALERRSVKSLALLGSRSFAELARILAGSAGYLGNDTGLGHLAEAVGVPALMVFGPTTPELGFGPWRDGSRSTGMPLWCRPCGKDGRSCFRLGQERYLCLKSLDPLEVEKAARQIWAAP